MALTLRAVKGSQLTQAEMDANMKEIGFVSSTVASAATTDLNTATGNYVPISGTTTITSFGSAAPTGTLRILKFAGALTLTHGASAIVLPGAINFVTRANDIVAFVHEGSGLWRCIDLVRADGSTLAQFLQFPAVFDNGSTPGATPTIDPTKGARQKITLNINVTTFTITAPPNSLPMNLQIDIFQDGTGGRTWPAGGPASSKWKTGADKVLSAAASARDRLIADYDGTAWICDLMKGIA
jgi:hypothetical protein